MCGFAAFFEKDRPFPANSLEMVSNDLYHRGPDSGGKYLDNDCAMVFRRLSILDPSPNSNQPMSDESSRFNIVFNGEIYNFRQIRKEIEKAGMVFFSESDTEVVLKGFMLWGDDIVQKLEGMFAFVIWDSKEKKGFVARDPLGIKPLYFTKKNGLMGFASEVRPLRRVSGTNVDKEALTDILIMRNPISPRSGFAGIDMLPGGTTVSFDLTTGKVIKKTSQDILTSFEPDYSITANDAISITRGGIIESVKSHLQSDVGFSISLSGGVDSSLITAIAAENTSTRINTFGISLDDKKHDESGYQLLVVNKYNTAHTELRLTGKDFAEGLYSTIQSLEVPTAHAGCVFLKSLYAQIQSKHKVCLVGEGADELFGGYSRYSEIGKNNLRGVLSKIIPSAIIKRWSKLHSLERFKNLHPALVVQLLHDHNLMLECFPDLCINSSYGNQLDQVVGFGNKIAAADQLVYLRTLLLRQDKVAMAHSIETRTPFAHLPLSKKINKIPMRYRLSGGETKPLLKKVAEEWLPRELIYRRKQGLPLPLDQWMRDEQILKPFVLNLCSNSSAIGKYADQSMIRKVVGTFLETSNQDHRLPKIISQLLFLNVWLEGIRAERLPVSF